MAEPNTQSLPALAIVGLSLKFPQDAVSSESFWDMIVEGRCASTDFPPDRLNIDAYYHPDPNRLDSLSVRGGHFMKEDISLFDAPFFSITAAEAKAMDPQQRLVLEMSYRALENAGITMDQVARSKTCVFTGSFSHDYETLLTKDLQKVAKWAATGTSMNMQSNRVSWFFNLVGPSATVDTACSSSLMAIDLACQSIWSGDSTMGMAIGSNAILALETVLSLDNLGLLSPDSRCYSFDRRGNGYARGEGIGALIIRPLDDAIRNGDTIRAVIRSSSSNQDGRTPGITMPSMEMQERLVRDTYRKGGLDMAPTRYFEAHGTGTSVGDPIESKGIGSLFRHYRSPEDPLYIGSVKSNIGHLEGASGIAGVIKTVLALENGIIPPNSTNFESLNPRIDDEFLHIKIPNKPVPWPTEGLRRASVSSFGFGGSNSHIVLDDAYNFLRIRRLQGSHDTLSRPPSLESNKLQIPCDAGPIPKKQATDSAKLLVWSSADEKGISRIQESWRSFMATVSPSDQDKPQYFNNLAHTLGTRRTHLPWRTFVVAHASDDWGGLPDKFAPVYRSLSSPNMALVFSGQGAQWYAMGRELLQAYPVFLQSIEAAGVYLWTVGCQWSLLDELQRTEAESRVNQPEYSQTMCTALQVALVDLLQYWNLTPKFVVGHSSGEIAAAYCTGAISRESAWKIAFYRGKLSGRLETLSPRKGTMLAVALSREDVIPYIEGLTAQLQHARINIACVNSPKSVTVSGDEILIDALRTRLDQDEVFARKLKVGVAYHSTQMQEIASDYRKALRGLEKPAVRQGIRPEMVSSVTGTWIESHELLQADYWVRNMVSPVLFSDALSTMCSSRSTDPPKKLDQSHRRQLPIHHLVEAGPHSVLQGPCKDILKALNKAQSVTYLSLLVRNAPAVGTVLAVVGALYSTGYPVNLSLVNIDPAREPKALSNLPEYPFDHSKSYWNESQVSKGQRLRRFGRVDLLGVPDANWNPLEGHWRHIIRTTEMPWVQDHKINDTILYPGMGMVVMAIEAAKQMAEPDKCIAGFNVKEIIFHAPIRIESNAEDVETGFYMRPVQNVKSKSPGWFEFRLCSNENQTWTENCTGSIQIVYTSEDPKAEKDAQVAQQLLDDQVGRYSVVQQAATSPMDSDLLYDIKARCGFRYGKAFNLINTLSFHRDDDNQVISQVRKFSEGSETIHPTTLDAIVQTTIWTLTKGGTQLFPTMVPTQIEKLWVSHDGISRLSSDILRTHATLSEDPQRGLSIDANAFDDELQQAMVEISGLRMNIVSASNSDDDILEGSQEPWCHHLEWKPDLELLSNPEVINFCTGKCEDPAGIEIFFTEVDFLLTATVLGTLRQLPKQGLDPAQPHLKKYVDWMLERKRLFDEGKVQFAFEPWKSRLNDPVFIQEVEDRVLKENKRGYLMASVARNLPLFLTGELNPLEFLFEGDQMKDFYFEGLHDSNGVKQLDTYLDLLAHQNPQMRILEVGAGTGSMTDIMLRYLGRADDSSNERRYGEWHYTDISRSFFGQAQDEFHQEGERIRFQPLDIEKDPETQGFECGTYDVVVASLVFHATSDLKRTLMNARKLLKPRGKLILNEFTATDVIRTAFVLGLLEGWWLSSEPYRKFGPCVDKSRWNELMQQAGFSGLDVALSDYDDIRSHEQSVLVSSAVEDYPAASQLPDIEIVYEPTEVGQAELAQSLAVLCRDLRVPVVRCTSVDGAGESISDNHLLRVFLVEWQKPVLDDIQPGLFQKLQRLLCSTADVLWINSGGGVLSPKPHFRLVDGLFRVLVAEDDRKKCYLLSLEDQETNKSHRQGQIMKVIQLLLSSAADDLDTEYVEQHGMLHIGRLIAPAQLNEAVSSRTTPKQHKLQIFGGGIPFQLDSVSSGLLQGFQFIEDESAGQALEPNEIEIEVKCAGINFRDVLIAVGQLKSPHTGFECSGVVVRTGAACKRFQVGDAVAALHAGCYSSVIRVRETGGVVKIGRGISFADAAAIPVNFATAYIALHDVARMRAGESILIHSGSGGTGQAAIQLAQNLGATVFTTVGSEAKKQFLMDVYNIPESHIFSSRTTLFAKAIKLRTGNRGVDVIFNSLAGESLQASWQCIAPYGRFLEIGIKDILANDRLPMLQFLDNVSFSAINLATMMHDRPEMCAAALASVYTLLEQRKVRPAQHVQVYGIAEMETAFRSMQSGKHIGKMVIEMRKDDQVMTVLNTKPSTSLDPDATYVISGGLGGLGRNIAHWLADRGARNLLLLSRSGLQSPKAQELVKQLQARDVRIMIPSCDVSNLESLQKVLDGCRQQMPPIKGCIQAAMVLRDALYETMSHQSWHEALAPKVQGSWNLHNQLPSGMDFFVMLSSIAGIFGMKGQANYAAGNTFQDALARYRVGLGEKATSVDLGVIGFTGAVVDNARLQERILSNSVMTPITEPEIHALLDLYCDPQATPYTALTCQTTVHISPNLDKMGSGDATWLNKPMFRHLCLQNGLGSSNTAQATNTNVAALLNQAQSLVEANEAIIHGLTARLSKALSIPVTEIDTDKPLHQYGVDSLVAVELRSWFAKDLQADIAVFDILGSATVRSVGQLATGKSKMTKEKTWS